MPGLSFSRVILQAACVALVTLVATPGHALLAAHDCSFCHDLHGAPGTNLLSYTDTEVLCLSCHATAIGTTEAAAVHNPALVNSDQPGYITCRECHNPHDNVVNSQGTTNIELVGFTFDPATGQRFAEARIREELVTGYGPYRPVEFADRTQFNIDNTYPGRGACQVCHSPNHNQGQTCTECHGANDTQHDHARGFLP